MHLGYARTKQVGLLPLIAGLRPEIGWRSLEAFINKVLPQLKQGRQKSGQN